MHRSEVYQERVNEADNNTPRVVLKHLPRVCEEASAEPRSFLGLGGTLCGSTSGSWHVFSGGRSSSGSRSRHDRSREPEAHALQCQALRPVQEVSPPIGHSQTVSLRCDRGFITLFTHRENKKHGIKHKHHIHMKMK